MSKSHTTDAYRFVVVYRRERGDTPVEPDQWRGRVLPVSRVGTPADDKLKLGFTDLDQVADIMRHCISDAVEKS